MHEGEPRRAPERWLVTEAAICVLLILLGLLAWSPLSHILRHSNYTIAGLAADITLGLAPRLSDGELATTDLWNGMASFAEGGVVPRGWAAAVGPTQPFIGVVEGGLTLNKTS
ncbi:hypothetical protein FOA52_010170 [Chlamydomonas sp. UWO 241]|nr:hypothetical protein FOA52_010170 [Chlamydomonas sp. UWO 241]